MIHCDRIISWLYGGLGHDIFVLCMDTVGKGITIILCRAGPAAKLILGSSKLSLCIIVLHRVP